MIGEVAVLLGEGLTLIEWWGLKFSWWSFSKRMLQGSLIEKGERLRKR
jgi:hypothetical protein